jgi:transcription initiation factor TFIID subunit 8
MPYSNQQPPKRSADDAGLDAPGSPKKLKHYHHHHRIHHKQHVEGSVTLITPDGELLRTQLLRSITLALKAVGFERADSIALESFKYEVEEYMAHFLAFVRQSMLSSRRTQPIPQDFIHALEHHQLTLRSLLPHLDPPVEPSKSLPKLIAEPAPEPEAGDSHVIGRIFADTSTQTNFTFVPRHFPHLPSRHTFKALPVFTNRETDARKIREKATEEGRRGEEALRKLVGATTSKVATSQIPISIRASRMESKKRGMVLWQQAMESCSKSNDGTVNTPLVEEHAMSMTLVVNSEQAYWRKPAMRKEHPRQNLISTGESRPP